MNTNINSVISLFLLPVILIFTSCASMKSPVVPGNIERVQQKFFDDAVPLFPMPCNDVDLSVIQVSGPDAYPGLDFGDQIQLDTSFGYSYFTGIVTLEEQGANFIPKLGWLLEDDTNGPCITYDDQGGFTGYQFPKLDTCYLFDINNDENSVIEAAICYSVLDLEHGDVDIGITTFRWLKPDFPDGQYDEYHLVFHESELDPPLPELNDLHPDIAYDNENGDIYIVWTRIDPNDVNQPKLYYRWFNRDTGSWTTFREGWKYGYPHKQWFPRIDVGRCGITGTSNLVGVVYTSKGLYSDDYYTTALAWWHTADVEGHLRYQMPLHVPVSILPHSDILNSGLPQAEIAPNSDPLEWGAVTFVQEVFDNPGNPDPEHKHNEVWVVDNLSNTYTHVFNTIGEKRGILPSIAIHPYLSFNHSASISYFEQVGADQYLPRACQYNPQNTPPDCNNFFNLGNDVIDGGGWQPFHLFYTNPGVSSDIAVLSAVTPDYWAAWCMTIDQGHPVPVMGNYGRTKLW